MSQGDEKSDPNRQSEIKNRKYLNRCLAVRNDAQHPIDSEVQQNINDCRDYQRHHQRVPIAGARAGDYVSKRFVEWIRHRDDELHEPGAAVGRQQGQKKPQPQQRIEHKKDVIDNLGDTSDATCASDFTLGFDYFIDGFGAELTGELIDALAFRRRRGGRALSYFCLYFAFDLRFDGTMLSGAARFLDCQFVVVHFYPPSKKTNYVPLKAARMRRILAAGYFPVAFTVANILLASASVMPA